MKSKIKSLLCGIACIMIGAAALSPGQATTPLSGRASAADQQWLEAEGAFNKSDFSRASRLLEEFVRRHPGDARRNEARLKQGVCESKLRRPGNALRVWKQVIIEETSAPQAPGKLALRALNESLALQQTLRDQPGSERILEQMLRFFPEDPLTVKTHVEEAGRRMAAGQPRQAVRFFERVERRLPPMASSDLAHARALVAAGVRGLTPEQWIDRADELVANSRLAEALELCRQVASQHPRVPVTGRAMYRQGDILNAQGKYEEALRAWKSLLEEKGGVSQAHAQALFDAARVHAFRLHKHDEALRLYEIFLAKYPGNERAADARFQAAGIHFERKAFAKAKRGFEEFLELYPDSSLAREARNWIEKSDAGLHRQEIRVAQGDDAPAPPTATASLIKDGNTLFRRGQYIPAKKIYERIIRQSRSSPEVEEATYQLGHCQVAVGDHEKALATFASVGRSAANSEWKIKALFHAASVALEQLNRPRVARAHLEQLLAAEVPAAMGSDAKRLLGFTWFRDKNYDEALPHFLAVRKAMGGPNTAAPPGDIDRLIEACEQRRTLTVGHEQRGSEHPALHIGDQYYTALQWQGAIEAYDRVIKESRNREEVAYALLHKGRCYYKLWEYEKALKCYLPFLDKFKGTKAAPAALLRAGVIYTGPMKDFNSARRMYQLSLERYPEDKEAARTFNNLLYLDYWEGKLVEALAKSEEYLRHYPDGEFHDFHRDNFQPRLRSTIAQQ